MPRKGHVAKRNVLPDPIYNSVLVTRLINSVMLDGKKGVAQQIIYGAFDRVSKATGRDPLEVYNQALENIMPQLEVRSRRVGGATFQVPTEIRPDRKESISMKNLIIFARKRGGKSMADKLAAEIMDAFNEQGGAFKRKEDMHRMAEANRAFAHFRF